MEEEKSFYEKLMGCVLASFPAVVVGLGLLLSGEIVIGLCLLFIPYILMFVVYRIFKFILRDYTSIEYKIEKIKNKDDRIYIRDIDSPLSPACVSYLINKGVDIKKDVVADILSLISKRALTIGPNFELVPADVMVNLTRDEQYILDWYINNDNTIDIDTFTEIIKLETKDYAKIRKNIIEWIHKISVVYFISAVTVFSITYEITKESNIITAIMIGIAIILVNADLGLIFLGAFVSNKLRDAEFFTYTKKGITELINFAKYKKFIEDFGRLDEAQLESIILWDKYLAYAVALNVNTEYRKININDLGSKFPTTMNGIKIDYSQMDKFIEQKIGNRLL